MIRGYGVSRVGITVSSTYILCKLVEYLMIKTWPYYFKINHINFESNFNVFIYICGLFRQYKKSRIRETMNLSTDVVSITIAMIFFSDILLRGMNNILRGSIKEMNEGTKICKLEGF